MHAATSVANIAEGLASLLLSESLTKDVVGLGDGMTTICGSKGRSIMPRAKSNAYSHESA